jgi:hypothetical protein
MLDRVDQGGGTARRKQTRGGNSDNEKAESRGQSANRPVPYALGPMHY